MRTSYYEGLLIVMSLPDSAGKACSVGGMYLVFRAPLSMQAQAEEFPLEMVRIRKPERCEDASFHFLVMDCEDF